MKSNVHKLIFKTYDFLVESVMAQENFVICLATLCYIPTHLHNCWQFCVAGRTV